MSLIQNKDAVAEIGIVKSENVFQLKASKYTYYDRWNMFFSEGIYYGSAHPDWASQGDSAFGSFKEYWSEVSNNKIRINPVITHPNEPSPELKTGIVNNYQVLTDGRYILKSILLPLKKYGSSNFDSYFRHADSTDVFGYGKLTSDAINRLISLYLSGQISFDYSSFISQGGKLIILFAGGANAVAGMPITVRARNYPVLKNQIVLDTLSRMDGIAVSCHEFGHSAMNWVHTNSGRYCVMNPANVLDKDCPSHPNPVFKLRKGWINAVPFGGTMNINNLPPVETSDSCAVITIYGNPSAAPDFSSGESYIVENRRRIMFDNRIIRQDILNQFGGFNGGLLVWQFSISGIAYSCDGLTDPTIKLITPNIEDSILCSSRGSPPHFFGFLPSQPLRFYKLDTNRTLSGVKLKTGIELDSITNTYGNPSGNISLKLNYKISEPPTYSYVVYNRGNTVPNTFVDLSGLVYYHQFNQREFYKVNPGTTFEFASKNNFFGFIGGIEARGTENQKVIFRGAGFSNQYVNYRYVHSGVTFSTSSFGSIDSLILDNIKIENIRVNAKDISINQNSRIVPLILRNVVLTNDGLLIDSIDVDVRNSYISDLQLENMVIFLSDNNYFCSPTFDSCKITFQYKNLFTENSEFILNNSFLKTDNTLGFDARFDALIANTFWKGIRLTGGGIQFNNYGTNYPKIRNAITGIYITEATEKVSIRNTKFENNRDYDISIYKISDEIIEKPHISKNTFSQDTNVKIASILLSECPNIGVDSNTITNTGYFGIILMNNESPTLNNNVISGGNLNGTHSNGIFSYNSNGYYKCNNIFQCMNYGIILDNSQPVLYNNYIGISGIGLFLTNNSNPIMAPGYLNNETSVLGGYNYIHHNASEEIYCNNSKLNSSSPFMYKGHNKIEDENPNFNDILIYNKEVSGLAPTIDCPDNYWGGESPSGRLFPDYSFIYDDYQTEPLYAECDYDSESADNESLPLEYLLIGNVLKNQYQENYNTALNYSNQLLALPNSNINPVISMNNLFTSTLFSNGNFTNLENYYLTLASQNSTDSVLSNASKNLAIESKIERNEIEPAISDYENIIFTSDDEEQRFYASINRSRAIRLLLDSLLNHGGDNMSANMDLENLYDKAIRYNTNGNSYLKKSNVKVNEKHKNTRAINSPNQIKTNEIHFPLLQSRVSDKIKNFNNLNENEKRTLIIEKNILDLAENNHLDGIASIDGKLKFLNHGSNSSPKTYKLNQNYPNPFNPITTINFEIPISGLVKLKIYDMLGREVSVLVNEIKEAGVYETEFNGTNFSSGIYFYKIESGDFVQVKRMVLIK